jgi:TRAP-type C4-dicarboxylate transport system permease small subunit
MTKIIHFATRVLLAVSAAVLIMMMFLTAVDVVMRYVFKLPIPGAFELVEYMMAFIVPFAIAFCAEQNGHVSVELFFKKLPKLIQKTLQTLISSLTMLFAAIITWQNFLYIGEIYRDHLASSVLLIPAYPFIVPVFIGLGIFAVVLFLRMFHPPPEVKTK